MARPSASHVAVACFVAVCAAPALIPVCSAGPSGSGHPRGAARSPLGKGLPFAGAERAPCTTDAHCSLNGACHAATGACRCLPQWTGAECGELNLAPVAEAPSGKRDTNQTTGRPISSWGGSVVYDAASGAYHMWAAEMAGGCGIGTWLSNSVVAHSSSADASGLYTRHSTTWPVFAHEPVVARAPQGEYVMYFTTTNYLGVGRDPYPYSQGQTPVPGGRASFCGNCPGDGSSGHGCPGRGRNWSMPLPTYMSWTMTPAGNWSTPVAVPRVQQAPLIDSNLSPIIFKNGSLLGLWRNDDGRGSIHVCTASNWRDPATYVQHTRDLFRGSGGGGRLPPLDAGLEGVEDPYLWQAADGSFHMLVHGACGYHAFSADGFDWATSPHGGSTCAFPRLRVPHQGGPAKDFARRERPHLVLGPDGFTPVALTTSVTEGHSDYSYTLVQAVRDAPTPTPTPTPQLQPLQPLRPPPPLPVPAATTPAPLQTRHGGGGTVAAAARKAGLAAAGVGLECLGGNIMASWERQWASRGCFSWGCLLRRTRAPHS